MRHSHVTFCLVVLLIAGCRDSAESEVVETSSPTSSSPPVELTWEAQLAAVRDGQATRIAITQATVSREQWQQLAEGCESLERLEVDAADITDSDLELLAQLPQLTLLKLGAEVGDDGIAQIAGVQTLEFLNFPNGGFHNESLALLAELPNLKQLRFHSPHVGDDGLAFIATLPQLRYLHIIACPMTADGLKHLHGMTQLQSFYLDGSDIADEAIYELLRALPSLHFHRDQLHLPDDPQAHEH